MSVPAIPPRPEPPAASRHKAGLSGCLVMLLVVIGIVLLLPGVCSLIFMAAFGREGGGALAGLWLISFAVSACGIWLIVWAVRNR